MTTVWTVFTAPPVSQVVGTVVPTASTDLGPAIHTVQHYALHPPSNRCIWLAHMLRTASYAVSPELGTGSNPVPPVSLSTLSSASLSTQSSVSLSTLSGPVVFDYVIVDSFVFDLSLSTLSSSTQSLSTQSSSTPPSHSPIITTWELSTYSEQSQLKHHSTATPILISYGHINNGSNLLHISSVDHIAPAPFECLGFNTPYKYLSKGNLIGVDLTPAKGMLTLRWYQLPPPR